MLTVVQRLANAGRELPKPATPLAAYVPAVRTGSLVFTAGQLPLVDGALLARGVVADMPDDAVVDGWVIDQNLIDVEFAAECAAVAALNAIAAIGTVIDDLDKIVRVVKLTGYVAAVPGFTSHPQVLNGASELIGEVWPSAGAHARSAVGVASLPLNSPVELELIVEVVD